MEYPQQTGFCPILPFSETLALQYLIRTFLQGVAHTIPPIQPPVSPWDLNLMHLFEPIKRFLHLFKVAFWSPSCLSHGFLTYVVKGLFLFNARTSWFLDQTLLFVHVGLFFLPQRAFSFLPCILPQKIRKLHLGVVRTVRVYLKAAASVCKTCVLICLLWTLLPVKDTLSTTPSLTGGTDHSFPELTSLTISIKGTFTPFPTGPFFSIQRCCTMNDNCAVMPHCTQIHF